MRIYFNLNTVAGKVLEKKKTIHLVLLWFDSESNSFWRLLVPGCRRGTDILPHVCILCFGSVVFGSFCLFVCFVSWGKKRSDADSDNSVTVKVVLKHFR